MLPEIGDYFTATAKGSRHNKTMFYKRVEPRDSDPMSDTIITVRQITEDGKALHDPGTLQTKHFILMRWPEGRALPRALVNEPDPEE